MPLRLSRKRSSKATASSVPIQFQSAVANSRMPTSVGPPIFNAERDSVASIGTDSISDLTAASDALQLSDSATETAFEDAREATDSTAASSVSISDEPMQPTVTPIPSTHKLTAGDVSTSEADLRQDLIGIRSVLGYFLNSRMKDAESFCLPHASSKLYYSLGYTLIQCVKSLMTFEPQDMATAIECCKSTMHICSLMKRPLGFQESLGRFVRGAAGLSTFNSMTYVERHAELVYVECLLLKAILGIAYSGDFLAFVKEALNLRSAYSTYQAFKRYLDQADASAKADKDLTSGVQLGCGTISLILSLLPGKVINIMSVFGFTGNRDEALENLLSAGQWQNPQYPSGLPPDQEGLRRPLVDAILLAYYLCISALLPVGKLDLRKPSTILKVNLERFPNGAFWLWFAGRLKIMQGEGEEAVEMYNKSIASQAEYIQLHHICYWDIATAQLGLGNYPAAYSAFDILSKRNNWSQALYTYAACATKYQINNSEPTEEIIATMRAIPGMMQRIAGKSIPIEKFGARKSKKFITQGRLLLPALELAFVLMALAQSPQFCLQESHLKLIDENLAMLDKVPAAERSTWSAGGWYDDFCLLHMLRGHCLRLIGFPEEHQHLRYSETPLTKEECSSQALKSFGLVFEHGPSITLDHYIVWFTHYECGKLYEGMKDKTNARKHYTVIVHSKGMEVAKHVKGKVSLQNAVVLRASSSLELMES